MAIPAVLPPALPEDPFQVMEWRVTSTYDHWQTWRELFVGDLAKARLMNKVAKSFFGTVYSVLFRDVLLALFKMDDTADRPISRAKGGGRRDNLSFAWLIQDTEKNFIVTPARAETITQLATKLSSTLLSLRPWRDWTLAHDDQLAAVGVETNPSLPITAISEAIDAAIQLTEEIGRIRHPDVPVSYRDVIAPGGVDALLGALDQYIQYRQVDLRSHKGGLLRDPESPTSTPVITESRPSRT